MAEAHDVALAAVAGSGDGRTDHQARTSPSQICVARRRHARVRPRGQRPGSGARPPAPTPLPRAEAAEAPAAPALPPARRPRARRYARRRRASACRKRRLTIARNLVEAQHTAAMLTTFNEVDMTALMALRERRKEAFKERHGVGLGFTSFFVKASVGALQAFPRVNAEIQGEEMVLKQYYDIGIAVGAPQGLVVPVLRDADRPVVRRDRAGDRRVRRQGAERHADARRSAAAARSRSPTAASSARC